MRDDLLKRQIDRVVSNGNCSGCGACALLSSNVAMALNGQGYVRPEYSAVNGDSKVDLKKSANLFKAICPGVQLTARSAVGKNNHEIFGPYISAWQGWASDTEIRYTGSSGGVLTALATWLIQSGRATSVVGSKGGVEDPRRTVVTEVFDAAGVAALAGSRYAPVANMEAFDVRNPGQLFVGKPCEASAASNLIKSLGVEAPPIVLSFFCAGTPSQNGTDDLVRLLGASDAVEDVKYRGDGWPGEFRVRQDGEQIGAMSYDESWGLHVGRQIQWRCKICPDGTGADADIAVGDFWSADENGYPLFDAADGNSVVIARSEAGAKILKEASEAGVIILAPIDLDLVRTIQPLQVERKVTLFGRLIGRLIGLNRVPTYRGYGLSKLASRHLKISARAVVGTARRSLRRKSQT